GAVIGTDTLVSTASQDAYTVYEMSPNSGTAGRLMKKSNNPSDPAYDPSAVAEVEYLCAYTDTDTLLQGSWNMDSTDNRPHIPLGIKVDQHTFAFGSLPDSAYWKFVIWDLKVKNIGNNLLKDLYFGIFNDGDVGNRSYPWRDDLTGFIRLAFDPLGHPVENIAWWADNEGDPNPSNNYLDSLSAKAVASFKFLKTPTGNFSLSYNWWTSHLETGINSWGPMKQSDFNLNGYLPDSLLGMPKGDKAKYRLMSNGEIDYDQNLTNLDQTAQGWLSKPDSSLNIANGFDQIFLFSVGKWDLPPGESLHFAFAIIMGDDFHGQDSVPYPFDMNHPESALFDFSDLLKNAYIVQKLYDSLISKVTDVQDEPLILPAKFSLGQNFPNPFNSTTTIQFRIGNLKFGEPLRTTLIIYNILGQKVRTLLNENKSPGAYQIIWDGKDQTGNEVSSGIYFYQLKAGNYKETKKLTLLK
ncbi:MAG TPA: FlgD immunoglobulin-like domain containing protein, partial [Terriglobales bacterium]|nr:FlgD immunoglobulin-like domain containing protein [Terriglobales bacterium]